MSGYGSKPFQFQYRKREYQDFDPPPAASDKSKHGYSTMNAIHNTALQTQLAMTRKRTYDEEDYFNEEPANAKEELGYQPAPGSPGMAAEGQDDSDDEEDTLDAFMAGINEEVKQYDTSGQKKKPGATTSGFQKSEVELKKGQKKGIRDDIEQEDDEESFYRFLEENPNANRLADDDEDEQLVEYDADGNPIVTYKKKYIDPLPAIDHTLISYPAFEKNFYTESEDIGALRKEEVEELRRKLGIKVYGAAPPKPICSFAHFGLDEGLMKVIRRSEYTQPTPIQAQGIPVALKGRDIIGIAKTGSGKTAAFILPMITHIMDQPHLENGDGPIGLILAPTRELSLQIYTEARKFAKPYGINVVVCYGGGNKWEQGKALEQGAEIVVATPGRMIDHIKGKATNLQRVTFLVLDEADRMFDMGFEPQVRSICDHVRPDRQCLMFSATFKKRVERLARDALTDAVKVLQGDLGEANTDITQIVKMMEEPASKWNWLVANIVELTATGSVLIFVTKKLNSEELANNLKLRDVNPLLLHGDLSQMERNEVIQKFRKRETDVLVATDVAARGLDIPHIRTVVNYDVARDIDTHTHRIGRTGRAGEKGTAYTLVSKKDKDFAGHLVRNLEAAGQEVPKGLLDLAMQNPWFKKNRFRAGEGRKPNVGGRGLGFSESGGNSSSGTSSEFAYGGAAATSSQPAVGPVGAGRLTALRDAFKQQYARSFQGASSYTTGKVDYSQKKYGLPSTDRPPPSGDESSSMPPPPVPAPPSSERSKKKSRWDS